MEQPVVPVDDLLAPGDEAAVDERPLPPGDRHGHLRRRRHGGRPQPQPGRGGGGLAGHAAGAADGSQVGVLRGFVGLAPTARPSRRPRPTGEVTVEGLVVDPGSFDGTAPKDLARLLAGGGHAAGAGAGGVVEPARADGAAPERRRRRLDRAPCPRPSCPRARTSATRRSGSSSPRSRSSGTRSCCAGSSPGGARRSTTTTRPGPHATTSTPSSTSSCARGAEPSARRRRGRSTDAPAHHRGGLRVHRA